MKMYDMVDAATTYLMIFGGALALEGLAFASGVIMAGNKLAEAVGPREAAAGLGLFVLGLVVDRVHSSAESDADDFSY